MNKKQITFCLLIGILLLAGILRFYQLDSESIWLDEGYALREAEKSDLSESLRSIKEENATPPLYFLFLRYWIMSFGKSEFILRLPSVIFSLISIVFVFLIGKELYNKKANQDNILDAKSNLCEISMNRFS